MNLLVTPRAEAQLAGLPEIAKRAVDNVLRVLPLTPHIGVRMEDSLGGVFYRKLVVVLRRRWTVDIVYQLVANDLLVEYIDPSWVKRVTLI